MNTLSEREHLVAEQYCKGLADKEVADCLGRSTWTIKAQKRDIYVGRLQGRARVTRVVRVRRNNINEYDYDLSA